MLQASCQPSLKNFPFINNDLLTITLEVPVYIARCLQVAPGDLHDDLILTLGRAMIERMDALMAGP